MDKDFILKFKFEKKNEWQIIRKSILFYLGVVFGFTYYLLTKESAGIFISLGFLMITVPQIFLHLQYKLYDRDKAIIVNFSKRFIRVEKKGVFKNEIRFSDIEKLIRKKGQRNEDNMTYALPTFFYNHTEIQMKNGEKIKFTDFIGKDIGLKEIRKEERISLFNFID